MRGKKPGQNEFKRYAMCFVPFTIKHRNFKELQIGTTDTFIHYHIMIRFLICYKKYRKRYSFRLKDILSLCFPGKYMCVCHGDKSRVTLQMLNWGKSTVKHIQIPG